jgi:hypothetical protein
MRAVQSTILDSGLDFPIGVAVDGTGNVFIGDYGNNRVVKVSPTGAQTTVASGLKLPAPYGRLPMAAPVTSRKRWSQ